MPGFSEKFAKLVRAHVVEVVFTKPVSLQSELCNLKPPETGCSARMWSTRWIVENAGCPTLGRLHNGSCVRTENDNNGFSVHAAHHHGVGGEEERETGVELFKWDEAQFLDADRHWKRRKIKESLYITMPTRPSRREVA